MKEISTDTPHIRVWDWPVRVFHWSLAICILIGFVTGESERFSLLHQTLGYAAVGLLVFRMTWGFIGTRYARFSQFVKGPGAVLAYLKGMREGNPPHHIGHNPVGGIAVLLLMGLVALTGFTGWLISAGDAPGWSGHRTPDRRAAGEAPGQARPGHAVVARDGCGALCVRVAVSERRPHRRAQGLCREAQAELQRPLMGLLEPA